MKAKALAKKRKPAQMEDQDYDEMVKEDREIDYSKPNVNANTDDEGNPIAKKDSISMAKPKSEQTQSDYEAYQAEMNRRKVGKAINRYRNKGSK